ncbi:hypothetical protein SteCoe_25421 [Stentor coeruleus]|uniref:Peptidase A1 domain-containing protein n=1 Tax=Stentor coeruleus TaxID=5963 RepID=A0A1R2BF99_9CILI|nr:hypothetical protein SteCoe_25421 [Stentor coeruleus]
MLYVLLFVSLALGKISIDISKVKRPENLQGSSSSLYNYKEVYYTGNLTIGTPPQNFSLIIDTGSSYLWIESSSCVLCVSFPHKFNSQVSSTFENKNIKKTFQYGGGEVVVGNLSKDIVSIGDGNTKISCKSYFVLAYQVSEFNVQIYDGILGLGFKGLSDDYPTLMDSLKSSGIIDQRIFAMYLNRVGVIFGPEGYGTKPSNLEIGGYSLAEYSYNNTFAVTVDIDTSPGYWQAEIYKIKLGSFKTSLPLVIFDSGTTLIGIPLDKFVEISEFLSTYGCTLNIYNEIGCSCFVASTFYFEFYMNSVILEIPTENLWYNTQGLCYLLASPMNTNFWIIGEVFLQNYYTVYDLDNKQIKFAPVYANLTSTYEDSWGQKLVISFITMLIVSL